MIRPLPFDHEPVTNAPITELDMDLVFQTMQTGYNLGRLMLADIPGLTPELMRDHTMAMRYLERFNGVTQVEHRMVPTVAGVLAFTHAPDKWIPSSGVDIARYETDPRFIRSEGLMAVPAPTRARIESVRGPIFTIIDRTVDVLREACTTNIYEGARIVNHIDTPPNVLRELTTNGVMHRDLQLYGAQVRVQIFPGYIEWISPGRLPPEVFPDDLPLTLELLLSAQFARNPGLARILFHRGYIEKFGFGLDDVVASLAEIDREPPEFHNDKHSFRVRVMRPITAGGEVLNLAIKESRQLAILLLFEEKTIWTPQAMNQRMGIPRSTLQSDLREMTKSGQLKASGATNSRVYRRGDTPEGQKRLL